jgi:hypothetical protein
MERNYRNFIFRKKCSFGILLQLVQGNLKCISGVSKRSDTKEGTQFRVIMKHEENFFFAFHLSLTRKSFWMLQLNYLYKTK